ncbi:TPA: hypothetical protein JZG45_003867 [Escherichia coli]|nr:hypothetical protein [Escherichia coli]
MTREQLELITALLAGQTAAIVHLSVKFAEHADLNKSELADSFCKTADLLEEQTNNRKIIAMVLNQIASGIENTQPEGRKDIEEQIKKLLH